MASVAVLLLMLVPLFWRPLVWRTLQAFDISPALWAYTAHYPAKGITLSGRGDLKEGVLYDSVGIEAEGTRDQQVHIDLDGLKTAVGSPIESRYYDLPHESEAMEGYILLKFQDGTNQVLILYVDVQGIVQRANLRQLWGVSKLDVDRIRVTVDGHEVPPLPISDEQMRKQLGRNVRVTSRIAPG